MKPEILRIKKEALEKLSAVSSEEELEKIRVSLLGRKGEVTALLKGLKDLSPEERPAAGKLINDLKAEIERAILQAKADLNRRLTELSIKTEIDDVTLPSRGPAFGARHPLLKVMDRICSVFRGLGFDVVYGPEVEDDYHNFGALNFPENHPARDTQDTFYIKGGFLLRTHTSPVQVRTMESRKPPIKIVAPGKVFRHDDDVSHSPVFHQVEGLLVDEGVTFSHLKGVLDLFLRRLFGDKVKSRYRASFFPFTEPSAEVDISCIFCRGKGCRVCKEGGWIEILGCGMVDPAVLEAVNIDSEKYTGFAFGLGVERIAMLLYGIDDIRLFYGNDQRFLEQF